MRQIISKLDLIEYIDNFKNFLAREKPLFMEGDISLHFKFIQKISKVDFKAPKEVTNLDSQLMYLKKSGHLKLYEIYEFVKIVEYFLYLKKVPFEGVVREWLDKIIIPKEIVEICNYFDHNGELRDEIDERFLTINSSLKRNKEQIKESIRRVLNSQKLSPYLVDKQIHYINDSETMLVRGGFNHFLKATVVARSSGGFFYVLPDSISTLKKSEADMLSQKDELIYEYEKRISSLFSKFEPFLSFANRAFDRFDNYQARVFFAKSKDLEFIKPTNSDQIKLSNFSHPALHEPKPISVDFSKKILMITGVNAGGKTMMLKSILSAVFLSKYLIPMKVDTQNSIIGHFKEITAIIDDPQNVKNDISTFAGRMMEFSKLFSKSNFIVGVDEIELGTDSDEAASLFKVILEKLVNKDAKIIITTHHKRLASMMATHDEVELAAALYDQIHRKPTYEFLYGTIGKSYAFETALRYGIPENLISEAKKVYGEDKEKLGELIQKNIELELTAKEKIKSLDFEIAKQQKLNQQLKNQKLQADEEIRKTKNELEKKYNQAIEEARKAAKSKDISTIHRQLNIAHKKKERAKKIETRQEKLDIKVGDFVKYNNAKGKVLTLKKDEAMIECDGIKLRVPIKQLKRSGNPTPKRKSPTIIKIDKPSQSSVKLDLHGLRAEEAIEKLDKYLSDVLLTGYDEVLVYHGVGSGKLAYAVKEFLKTHPSVKAFSDAPANMGGMGATVVRL
jgi:DNA mismatch repair protein MutS2